MKNKNKVYFYSDYFPNNIRKMGAIIAKLLVRTALTEYCTLTRVLADALITREIFAFTYDTEKSFLD